MSKNIIKNDSDLFVTGEIGYDFLAEDFIRTLAMLPNEEVINVHIYSGGGSLFDALAVYDYVKGTGVKFNAYISGLAGSAATVIGAAAENTYIGANSFYFVHRAFNPSGDNSEETQRLLDNANDRLIKIYQDLTGLTRPRVKQLLDAGDKGAFLTAKEAKDLGFVSDFFKESQLAASNEWYKDLLNNHIKMENDKMEELKSSIVNETIDKIKNFFTEKEKEVSSEALEKTVKDEVGNRVDDVVNSYEEKIKELVENNESKEVELKNEIESLKNEIESLKVEETGLEGEGIDPNPDGEKVELSENQKVLNSIFNELSPAEKIVARKRAQK
jgi:ATP-dependent protease ClpP protease subunit